MVGSLRRAVPGVSLANSLRGCFDGFGVGHDNLPFKISSLRQASSPTWYALDTYSINARKCSISSDANVTPPRQSRSRLRSLRSMSRQGFVLVSPHAGNKLPGTTKAPRARVIT